MVTVGQLKQQQRREDLVPEAAAGPAAGVVQRHPLLLAGIEPLQAHAGPIAAGLRRLIHAGQRSAHQGRQAADALAPLRRPAHVGGQRKGRALDRQRLRNQRHQRQVRAVLPQIEGQPVETPPRAFQSSM